MTLGKLLNPPVPSFLICQVVILVVTGTKRHVGHIWSIPLLSLLFPAVVGPIGGDQRLGGLGCHMKELDFIPWAQRAPGDLWAGERQIISGLGNVTNWNREAGLGQGSIQRQVQMRAA